MPSAEWKDFAKPDEVRTPGFLGSVRVELRSAPWGYSNRRTPNLSGWWNVPLTGAQFQLTVRPPS